MIFLAWPHIRIDNGMWVFYFVTGAALYCLLVRSPHNRVFSLGAINVSNCPQTRAVAGFNECYVMRYTKFGPRHPHKGQSWNMTKKIEKTIYL